MGRGRGGSRSRCCCRQSPSRKRMIDTLLLACVDDPINVCCRHLAETSYPLPLSPLSLPARIKCKKQKQNSRSCPNPPPSSIATPQNVASHQYNVQNSRTSTPLFRLPHPCAHPSPFPLALLSPHAWSNPPRNWVRHWSRQAAGLLRQTEGGWEWRVVVLMWHSQVEVVVVWLAMVG